MEQFEHRRKDVERYLRGQLRTDDDPLEEEELDHVELIQEEWIGTTLYEIWDCRTVSHGRWWVVGPLLNLYSQDDFKSADYTLTFHIGITERLMRRSDGPPEPRAGRESLHAAFVQFETASDAANQVVEVREAQAVGVALREALVSLAAALVDAEPLLATGNNDPKRGDFVGWSEQISGYLAPGRRAARLRSFLRSIAKDSWQYVNWLTHDRSATKGEAMAGALMVQGVYLHFTGALEMHEAPPPAECPVCGSRRIGSDTDFLPDEIVRLQICETCGWESDVEVTAYPAPITEEAPPPDGDCTYGNEGPGR